jgi:predicted RND superfamily exporter protein
MAIFGLEFNLINIVISTFIFGIGVDYSIFVMEGLLSEAREGENKKLAYHKVAIVFSAMVLAIVTFSLIFATHPSLKSIGLITLIGMASTILITYSLQPFVFRRLAKIPYFRRSFRIEDK